MKERDKVSGHHENDGTPLVVEMDSAMVALFKCGEATHLQLTLDDDNKDYLLENVQGHLILITEEMPMFYHGCYYWNNGEFPYAIKRNLKTIEVTDGTHSCLLSIVGHTEEAGRRFRLGAPGEPSVDDENGDSCLWTITFQVEVVADGDMIPGNKTYLLRWNPAISSFREEDYRRACEKYPDGFYFNWSVYEWEDAHMGDSFYMLRTGDEKAGLVFRGVFTSDPYPGEDWAGKGKQRHYMDMSCWDCVDADKPSPIDIDKLEKAVPGIDWHRGHSGQLLSGEDAEKLDELWETISKE